MSRHHIPLDQERKTIATLKVGESEDVIKQWLRNEINRLERDLAAE